MKAALSLIPTEVWMDILCLPWISRPELGKIVDRIGNRKFAEFLQFYLHDWGKHTIGKLCFKKGCIIKSLYFESYREKLHFALTPMPEKIRFFKQITITHFDSEALAFLRRISILFLLNEVNLIFTISGFRPQNALAKLRPILEHMAPLFQGIHSMTFDFCAIPLMKQHFGQKLAQIKMLGIDLASIPPDPAIIQAGINFCMDWLTSGERDPTEPRYLRFYTNSETFQQFIKAIQEQFQSAKSPCTFVIWFRIWDRAANNIANFHSENDLNEQLDGNFNAYRLFQVNRHPPNAGIALWDWIAQTVVKSDKSNCLKIPSYVTIGQIYVNAGENEINNNAMVEEELDHPSTSKKPKLA